MSIENCEYKIILDNSKNFIIFNSNVIFGEEWIT
jgi:hypothetical protein